MFAFVALMLVLGLMLCLAKAEPDTARLRVHRKQTIEREMARIRRDRF